MRTAAASALVLALACAFAAFSCAEGSTPPPAAQGGASAGGGGAGGQGAEGGAGTTTGPGGGGAGGGATGGGGDGTGGAGGPGGCGDGLIDPGEECDNQDLDGATCQSLGYTTGDLVCGEWCTYDTSVCDACGNGIIQPAIGEDCDFDGQGEPLVLATCASLGFTMSGGNPGCGPTCHYDTKPCSCGDGVVLPPDEECDGADLDGTTCQDLGFAGGTLACLGSCEFDTSGCNGCGNGVLEQGEACDDGNSTPGDGCDAMCQIEAVACDPDGAYAIQGAPFSYTCCLGLVSINVSSFIFTNNGASIASSPSNPATMTGAATTCPSGSFSNTATIPGGCTEQYSLAGTYTNQNTWTGTYSVTFTGSDCTCFNGMLGTPCINQVFPVTAMR